VYWESDECRRPKYVYGIYVKRSPPCFYLPIHNSTCTMKFTCLFLLLLRISASVTKTIVMGLETLLFVFMTGLKVSSTANGICLSTQPVVQFDDATTWERIKSQLGWIPGPFSNELPGALAAAAGELRNGWAPPRRHGYLACSGMF
jgi:hypothetical protein